MSGGLWEVSCHGGPTGPLSRADGAVALVMEGQRSPGSSLPGWTGWAGFSERGNVLAVTPTWPGVVVTCSDVEIFCLLPSLPPSSPCPGDLPPASRCLVLGPSLSRHFPRFLPVPCFVCSQSVSFVSVFAKAIRSLPLRCQPARTTAIVSLSDPGKQESSGSGTRRGAARASLLGEVGQGMEPFPAIQHAS
uniref:Uncharacterized protein n=1 Tax=Junco hyemalis TaxID=40217 RepID=A0A8C5IL21_JUNHY